MVTMASEQDLRHPEIGKIVEKYIKGVASVPTEHSCRVLRLIENVTLGTGGGGIPDRIHAWRRLATGAKDYDLTSGKSRL